VPPAPRCWLLLTPCIPARGASSTTWHSVYSFNPSANNYLRTLQKGQRVYVEANFELREPQPDADPTSPQGQRQIFLRHGAPLSAHGAAPRWLADPPLAESLRSLDAPPKSASSEGESADSEHM
jgi:hypothetical protein